MFTSKNVKIAAIDTGEVIYENTCDHHSRLWYLDIAELITLGRRQTPPTQLKPYALGGRRGTTPRFDQPAAKAKAGRIGQEEVSAILWLHNCLNHSASPAVIANALRDGAWMGIDMWMQFLRTSVFVIVILP